MLERVSEYISQYHMFGPGQKVGVAVSGGADSVALLHILFELRPRWDLRLMVLHLDHKLRGEESQQDSQFVIKLAQSLGLPYEIGEADVAHLARESGDNLEQAARLARQRFFRDFLSKGTVDRIALGHTRSDQGETVLYRLLRGSGTAGLSGIRPVNSDGFVRPMLGISRSEVLEFLHGRGIEWREDSSNQDTKFDRNRIRHQLLPALSRDWNPALPETLANMAILAQDEETYWEKEIDALAGKLLTIKPPAVLIDRDSVATLSNAAARRLLRRAVSQARSNLRKISFLHIEQILSLVRSGQGDGRIQIPDLEVTRSFGLIRLAPQNNTTQTCDYRLKLSVPGRYPVCEAAATICLELLDTRKSYSVEKQGYNTTRVSDLDWARILDKLELRNWKPGDRFQPSGCSSARKMKLLFTKARIPSWERQGWPIITIGNTIIWTRGFGVAEGFAPSSGSHHVLRIWETEINDAL